MTESACEGQTQENNKNSKLLASLREGISLVQMITYKELRTHISTSQAQLDQGTQVMLCGAIINEIYGSRNPEPRFSLFREKNWGMIEQELLSVKESCGAILPFLTDSLRVQVLCDSQDGGDSAAVLITAARNGYLVEDRDIPLPSTFMTLVRTLGEKHGLVIAPAQITPEEDQALVQ